MDQIISDKFGLQIVKRDSKLFVLYDNGHFASKMNENEITSEEAQKAIQSEKDAYEVILKAQQRDGWFHNSSVHRNNS